MEDEFEDKVFYQAYIVHMKILSKFAVGVSSINTPLTYLWKLCRLYILRPEVLCCGVILFCLFLYLQAVDTWSRGILARIQATLSGRQKTNGMKLLKSSIQGDHQCWEDIKEQSSAFAILGRRPRMEDRFIIEENINNNTGISLFAVFDGHGGEFAADFAKDILVPNIFNKVIETIELLNRSTKEEKHSTSDVKGNYKQNRDDDKTLANVSSYVKRRNSLLKSNSSYDDCTIDKKNSKSTTDAFTLQLNSLMNGAINSDVKENLLNNNNIVIKKDPPPTQMDAKCYIENGEINFTKLITDEVLAADYKLIEMAKRNTNIAGTTALIAVIHGSRLVVANVGDSRGVMCNSRGIAIPLSFDHKPQQVRERKRIRDAGGFIAFRGVWRVAGILATSRALGDYPLKDKKLVIANPDVLTFELNYHKPMFLILASDGLWDTFSNEEACNYIKQHINERDFGAKSLVLQSYSRGSIDNITVLVIVFKNGTYHIGSSTQNNDKNNNKSTASSSASASMCLQSYNIQNKNITNASKIRI